MEFQYFFLVLKNNSISTLRLYNYQSFLSVIAFLENMKSCCNKLKHRKSITKNINNFLMLLGNTMHLIIGTSLVKIVNYQYCQGLGWEYQFIIY